MDGEHRYLMYYLREIIGEDLNIVSLYNMFHKLKVTQVT